MLSLFRQSGLVDQSRSAELGGAKGAAVSGRCQRVRLRQIAHVQRAGRRMGVVSGSSASHTPGSSPASRSRSGYPFAQRWTSPGPRRSSQTRLVSTLICKCLTRSKKKTKKTLLYVIWSPMVVPQKGSGCVSQLDWQIGHVNYNLPPFHRFLLPSLNSWRLIFVCVRSDIFVCSSSDGLGTPKPAVSSWRRSTSPSHWGIKLHRHKTLVLPPFFLFPVPARRSRPHAVRIYTNYYIARAMHILPTKKREGWQKNIHIDIYAGLDGKHVPTYPRMASPVKEERERKKNTPTHRQSNPFFLSLSLHIIIWCCPVWRYESFICIDRG